MMATNSGGLYITSTVSFWLCLSTWYSIRFVVILTVEFLLQESDDNPQARDVTCLIKIVFSTQSFLCVLTLCRFSTLYSFLVHALSICGNLFHSLISTLDHLSEQ